MYYLNGNPLNTNEIKDDIRATTTILQTSTAYFYWVL